ncbi:hypothetical protein J504_3517 [Acinetobacter baumannii 348935]|nr:hypothetical protein J504_3517 [Acinetobacter baumannii 348935]
MVKVFGELASPVRDEKDEQIQKLKNEIMSLRKQMNLLKNHSNSNNYNHSH